MSEPAAVHQEDLTEAAAAALRSALEALKGQLAALAAANVAAANVVQRIDEALSAGAGRTFLEHLRRLETENAELRTDVPAYLAENLRLRNLLVALESCPHACQDAGFCPHYARLRRLGLRA